jgi:cytochrome c oxidase subunit II
MTGPGRVTDRRRTIITAALRTPVRLLLPVLLVFAGTLFLTPVAMADFWSPEDGTNSPNAEGIDNLYWILFALSCVVFVGVEGALIYSLFKFRARKGAVPAQIRGNTRLEIGWTVGAAVILVIIAIVTFIQLGEIRTAPNTDQSAGLQLPAQNVPGETGTPDDRAFPRDGRALKIKVNGQQYVWRYTYPDGDDNTRNDAFDYETLVVPTDTTVTLEITAQDVAHSWWIPDAGGKFDAVPGHKNYTWLKIPGKMAGKTFRGQCAELCGRNHANMIAHMKAVTPDEYEAYIERRKREIAGANESAAEQRREIEGQ